MGLLPAVAVLAASFGAARAERIAIARHCGVAVLPFIVMEELVERGCHIWYAAADRGLCSSTTS